MVTIAVTGHIDLSPDSIPLVRTALDEMLTPLAAAGELTGVSCIARGADTLFAQAVLAAGGRLLAIIPSQDYRHTKVKPDHAPTFDKLIEAADDVAVLPYASANRDAYEAANKILIERADHLVAVWDGQPPTSKGGTADTVTQARAAGVPVDIVWPDGAIRTRQ
ncbi:hypothetical protein GCM10027059_03510 [Myceligenerans halotolerans]